MIDPAVPEAPGSRSADPAHTPARATLKRSGAILVYLLLLVSLQIFLLVVAVEGLLADEPGLARSAAVLSVVVFASTIALRWFVGDR